jgi:hypothetical protein
MPTFKLVCASADQWKAWEHDRWMTAKDKPGCMFIYGDKSADARVLTPSSANTATTRTISAPRWKSRTW